MYITDVVLVVDAFFEKLRYMDIFNFCIRVVALYRLTEVCFSWCIDRLWVCLCCLKDSVTILFGLTVKVL